VPTSQRRNILLLPIQNIFMITKIPIEKYEEPIIGQKSEHIFKVHDKLNGGQTHETNTIFFSIFIIFLETMAMKILSNTKPRPKPQLIRFENAVADFTKN
jgi:hypothetical protein